MLFVVSVTVTSVYSTVIGGLHGGWKVAVSVGLKLALPFCTGKSPAEQHMSEVQPPARRARSSSGLDLILDGLRKMHDAG